MSINGGVLRVRRLKVLGASDDAIPVASEIHEAASSDPLSGEIITTTEFAAFDLHGSPIRDDTQLVLCCQSKAPVAIFNAFQCVKCHGYFSTFHMANDVADELPPPAKPSIRHGICRACHDKSRAKRMVSAVCGLLGWVLRFLLAPFLAPSSDKVSSGMRQPPPASGGAGIVAFAVLSLFSAMPAPSRVGSAADPIAERTVNGGHMHDAPSVPIVREAQSLIQEAVLYGLDSVTMSPTGARYVRNLHAGIETGRIPEYDYRALLNLLGRAKRCILPMEWRAAFNLNPPPEIISHGDRHPIALLEGTPVGLTFLEMAEGIRSTGRSGSTKSTLSAAILDASAASGKCVIVFDSKGDGQFDYLVAKHLGRILKVRVGRPNAPFFNPWQYFRAVRDYFITIFSRKDSRIVVDVAAQQSVKQAAINGAMEVTHDQLLQNVVACATPPGFPSIPKDFRRSMFSVFYDIAQSPLYPQIACQRGYSLVDIVKRGYGLIIDTSRIAATLQEEFLICSLLAALRDEIKADPVLSTQSGPLVVFLIDECTQLAAASRAPIAGLPSLVHTGTLVRSSNIALFCTYHSMASVHPVLNAAGTWFVMQISDGLDLSVAKRTFSLTDAQAKALTCLPKGVAMMRMGNRYTEPFLVTYPRIPEPKKMSDAEIDANNAPILASLPPLVPEDYHGIPVSVATVTRPPAPAPASAPTVAASATPSGLTPGASSPGSTTSVTSAGLDSTDYRAVLHDIASNPFLNVTTRAANLKLPSGKSLDFKALKVALEDLAAQKFIEEVAVQLAPHAGSPSLMHYLVGQGYTALGSLYAPSRGGFRHDFGQRLIKHILAERSIPATVEMALPGSRKLVDVGVICPVTTLPIALEIATSTFDSEPAQSDEDLSAGWARVLQVAMNKHDLVRVVEAFARQVPDPDSRIKVCPIATLKAAADLPSIYDSPEFVVKVKSNRKKGA